MALPKIDKLSSEFTVSENDSDAVKIEIEKLGIAIQDSTTLGMKAAQQAVVGNVPQMIKELTEDIKSGSIDNFSIAMNKLIKLVNDLGINLRDYNEDLAEVVDKFTNKQMKLEDKLSQWREMGLKAEIKNGEVRLLTQRDVFKAQKEKIKNEKLIETKIAARDKLQANLDNKVWENSKSRTEAQKKVVENEEKIAQLRLDNEEIDKKTGTTTADTGRDTGMSKFTELKEAFMVIPDTIGDAMTSFGKAGKGMFTGLTGLFKKGGLVKAFKGLAGFFKTARIMIMAKFLLVIAAFQFLAEKIDSIVAFFKKIWDKIAGFFKSIGDWFANSWLGKKLGLGDGQDTEAPVEPKKAKSWDQLDEGTYAVGEEGAEIKDANLSVEDILKQSNTGDASVAEGVALDNRARAEGNAHRGRNYTGSMRTVRQDDYANQVSIDDIIGGKEVTGNQLKDGSTSSMLKSLESESAKSSNNVVNIQNNSNVNSNSSNASNVSGFIDHEPDTSFKYVRRSNGDEYI